MRLLLSFIVTAVLLTGCTSSGVSKGELDKAKRQIGEQWDRKVGRLRYEEMVKKCGKPFSMLKGTGVNIASWQTIRPGAGTRLQVVRKAVRDRSLNPGKLVLSFESNSGILVNWRLQEW